MMPELKSYKPTSTCDYTPGDENSIPHRCRNSSGSPARLPAGSGLGPARTQLGNEENDANAMASSHPLPLCVMLATTKPTKCACGKHPLPHNRVGPTQVTDLAGHKSYHHGMNKDKKRLLTAVDYGGMDANEPSAQEATRCPDGRAARLGPAITR